MHSCGHILGSGGTLPPKLTEQLQLQLGRAA